MSVTHAYATAISAAIAIGRGLDPAVPLDPPDDNDLCECGERIEDECLTSCTCSRCEHGDLEAEIDRAEYLT